MNCEYQEAEAKSIQALVENNARQAGEKAGEEASKDCLEQAAEEAFLADIIKICEEEGLKKGQEVFGDFGGQVVHHHFSLIYLGSKSKMVISY